MNKRIEELTRELCELVEGEASKLHEVTGREMHSITASLLRPYLYTYFNGEDEKAAYDRRERLWNIKLYFWDMTRAEEHSEDLVAETETEQVKGLGEVIEAIQEYVDDFYYEEGLTHEDIEEFSFKKLNNRMKSLRPSIWRGSGKATARINYTTPTGKRHLLQMDIERA